jgi:hypothetical protein
MHFETRDTRHETRHNSTRTACAWSRVSCLVSRVSVLLLALALAPRSAAAPRPDDKAALPAKDAPKAAPKDNEPAKLTEGFVRFRIQEIDKQLRVGYAVIVADVNGDGKPDIVVVDTDRVYWYENPTWQRRTIIENKTDPNTGAIIDKKTEPDNVSIAAAVIDGKVNFVLAAAWTGRFDSKKPGTLQWLRRGKSLDEPWEVIPIPCDEPTIHRVQVADLAGDGKPYVVVAPLMGRDSSRTGNWSDGRPVRIVAYKVPADPAKGPWIPEVINESLHVVHGLSAVPAGRPGAGSDLLFASYEGVTLVGRDAMGKWLSAQLAEGDQRTPLGIRGASEVKFGTLKSTRYLATIEPWHGYQVVVNTPGAEMNKAWERRVIDKNLRWGHAVWCADLDGDGTSEVIVGVRDDPARGDTFTEKRGVRIYRCQDAVGKKWERLIPDEGGVAVEDLTVADLNGDGRPDIIAVGRQTGNVKIYWNVK